MSRLSGLSVAAAGAAAVAAVGGQSPFSRGKRSYSESEENQDSLQVLDSTGAQYKRLRQQVSPSGRCAPGSYAYAVGHSTVSALRGLFPEMSDKVIADVLAEYGDNIDAAIKHLTELRLSAGTPGGSSAAAAAEGSTQQQAPRQEAQAQAQAQTQGQQQAQQQGQQQVGSDGGPQTAAEWVEVVVQQMSQAADLADARVRASKVLQAFEQAALQHAKAAPSADELGKAKAQVGELSRENALLKRAVAIQAGWLQELAGREAEVAQLRAALEGYQARVHSLEVQNFSLSMHLKAATDGRDPLGGGGLPKNPDVF